MILGEQPLAPPYKPQDQNFQRYTSPPHEHIFMLEIILNDSPELPLSF
jgi:hypothetical protein